MARLKPVSVSVSKPDEVVTPERVADVLIETLEALSAPVEPVKPVEDIQADIPISVSLEPVKYRVGVVSDESAECKVNDIIMQSMADNSWVVISEDKAMLSGESALIERVFEAYGLGRYVCDKYHLKTMDGNPLNLIIENLTVTES